MYFSGCHICIGTLLNAKASVAISKASTADASDKDAEKVIPKTTEWIR